MKAWLGRRPLTVILLVALALRLAAGFWWHVHARGGFEFGDSDGYWVLGRAVAHGGPYRYGDDRVFRAPGYPIILAPLFLWTDNPPVMAARAESALLGTAAVAAVAWLAGLLFDRRTALIAAALAAVYPGVVALGGVVLSEAAFCPLMIVQLALWAWAGRSTNAKAAARNSPSPRPSPARGEGGLGLPQPSRGQGKAGKGKEGLGWALAAGVVGGLATLTRPSWLLFSPLAIVAGVAIGPNRLRRLIEGGVVLAGLVLTMLPWWMRNAQVTGHFVPTTLQVGASLYDGLNPGATGASDMTLLAPAVADARRAWEAAGRPDSFEYYLDRRLRGEALRWAGEHPAAALRLAAVKLARFWNIWPNEASLSGWALRLIVVFTFVPIVILGIIGAHRRLTAGWPWILCALPAVYLTLLHLVFVSSLRYREPAVLGLIVLAAAVLSDVTGRTRTTTEGRTSKPE